ncbi:MAG TPA: hypothetical protein VFN35_18130, partial [Ktedonobacteraceae bacterium]|nr:hypothetical protein [Ktedonobacteraceae bacterium]
ACSFKATWNSYVCKHHYVDISIESEDSSIAPLTLSRNDGVTSEQNGSDPNYVSVSALPGYTYTWKFAGPSRALQIDLLHTKPGDWVELAVSYPSAKLHVYRDAEQSHTVSAAKSMDEFNASKGNKYFYDSTSGMLYLKLIPQSGTDWARVNIGQA